MIDIKELIDRTLPEGVYKATDIHQELLIELNGLIANSYTQLNIDIHNAVTSYLCCN